MFHADGVCGGGGDVDNGDGIGDMEMMIVMMLTLVRVLRRMRDDNDDEEDGV